MTALCRNLGALLSKNSALPYDRLVPPVGQTLLLGFYIVGIVFGLWDTSDQIKPGANALPAGTLAVEWKADALFVRTALRPEEHLVHRLVLSKRRRGQQDHHGVDITGQSGSNAAFKSAALRGARRYGGPHPDLRQKHT